MISRREVFELALRIIDAEGVAAVSTRRLGQELGINGTSLYYHFKSIEEIISGAAELALRDVRTPDDPDTHWTEWFPENVLRTRRVLLEHPNLIPVVSDRRRLGIGERAQDETVRRLVDQGVPPRAVMPLMLSLELFAIGSALHESQNNSAADGTAASTQYPALAQARADSALVGEDLLQVIIASVIDAVMTAVPQESPKTKKSASTTRPAPARKATPESRAGRRPRKSSAAG